MSKIEPIFEMPRHRRQHLFMTLAILIIGIFNVNWAILNTLIQILYVLSDIANNTRYKLKSNSLTEKDSQ